MSRKLIACTYRVNGDGNWEPCDENFWLVENEEAHHEARRQVLLDVAEGEGGKVEIRYEVWVEDPTYVMPGEASMWSLYYPDISESATYATAEEALQGLAEFDGGVEVQATRLVRVHTYGQTVVDAAPMPDESDEDVN